MLRRSTIQLLRFHFSLFLLPVYLFAISQLPNQVHWFKAIAAFFILHFFVYPSSNGYNSYMDRDDSPIGGLKKPLQPTRQLFTVSVVMDVVAIVLSLYIHALFALGILFYILASRTYSYRRIRLKQYPIFGFLTVFIFQGAVVFYITYMGCSTVPQSIPWLQCFIASLLIGASYPLTQIYQHQQDKADGVVTISYKLGKRGTFVFSFFLFTAATIGLFILFKLKGGLQPFYLFLACMLPVVLFFSYWCYRVWKNENAADFKNSLRMNIISTLCMLIYFSTLIIQQYF